MELELRRAFREYIKNNYPLIAKDVLKGDLVEELEHLVVEYTENECLAIALEKETKRYKELELERRIEAEEKGISLGEALKEFGSRLEEADQEELEEDSFPFSWKEGDLEGWILVERKVL